MSATTAGFTHRLFHEFFPPPKFLEMPAVGLDISDTAVTALELTRRRGGSVVGRFGRRPLPRGAIADGFVHDTAAVVSELRALRNELRLSFVNASLPEEKAYLYTTTVPVVSQAETRSAIEFTLEENVPLSPPEALFDYTVFRNAGASSGAAADIAVTVLPHAVVRAYVELFPAAGLVPLSLELRAQAVCRAVIARGDRGAYVVLQVEAEKVGLFFVREEAVLFTATIALRPDAVAAVRDEVQKHIAYWQMHADHAREGGSMGAADSPMKAVVLCGRDADTAPIGEALSRSLEMPVEFANVWRNGFSFDAYIPPIAREESFEYAAAVGLALPKSP